MKTSLPRDHRRILESTVAQARTVAEDGAVKALKALAVGATAPQSHATPAQKKLRVHLRAHGRALGDVASADGSQASAHLVTEIAYEHWHRMLFARFLAESHLLMHPDAYPVSLADCKEDAALMDPPARSEWEVAGRYASAMLPNVFRVDSPVLALELPLESGTTFERVQAFFGNRFRVEPDVSALSGRLQAVATRMGEHGFDSSDAAGAFIILLTLTHAKPAADQPLQGIDASAPKSPGEKAVVLAGGEVVEVSQAGQLGSPDGRVVLEYLAGGRQLSTYAESFLGLGTGDFEKYGRNYWEFMGAAPIGWRYLQCSPVNVDAGGGQAGEATLKLARAEALKAQLTVILDGAAPHDIFVRWKPLHQQAAGWDPDLNDGVRMNIRPFVEAGVLRLPRNKLGIKWEADRGKDVASAPWYKLGPAYGEPEGTRINDHHLSLAEKQAARAGATARTHG